MKKEKTITLIRLTRPILHSLIIICIYYIAYLFRSNTQGLAGIDIGTPQIAIDELISYSLLSSAVFLGIGIIKRRYNLVGVGLESSKKFFSIRGQRTVIITCLAYFGQGFLFNNGISRYIIIQVALFSFFIIPLIDSLWRWFYTKQIKQFSHSALIIYQEQLKNQDIAENIKLPAYYDIRKVQFSGKLNKIKEDLIVLVGGFDQDELQKFIDIVRLQNKQLYHIGNNHFLEDVMYKPIKIGGIWSLRYTSSQIEGRAAITKRIVDIAGSMVGIILTFPIMVLTAIAIKKDSSGPILYIQSRVGKNGKTFPFIKFRTMYTHLSVGKNYGGEKAREYKKELMDSDLNIRKGELQKIINDPRVTKVGKFLRNTSLDELPNLFSVLQGNMSLIGPRPHEPFEINRYKPWQRRVLSVKPGVTGYAQIQGRDSLSFDEEASKELEYIQNRSLRLDFYIIFATFGVLFDGRGK